MTCVNPNHNHSGERTPNITYWPQSPAPLLWVEIYSSTTTSPPPLHQLIRRPTSQLVLLRVRACCEQGTQEYYPQSKQIKVQARTCAPWSTAAASLATPQAGPVVLREPSVNSPLLSGTGQITKQERCKRTAKQREKSRNEIWDFTLLVNYSKL